MANVNTGSTINEGQKSTQQGQQGQQGQNKNVGSQQSGVKKDENNKGSCGTC